MVKPNAPYCIETYRKKQTQKKTQVFNTISRDCVNQVKKLTVNNSLFRAYVVTISKALDHTAMQRKCLSFYLANVSTHVTGQF